MKTKMLKTLIKYGIVFNIFLVFSFSSFSQSCHNGGSSQSSQNNGSDKSIIKSAPYKKSTKKIYYKCKKHPTIKNDSKSICSICNRKLKKKFEYFYD